MILDEKNILKNIIEFKNDLLKKINSLESKLSNKINLHDKDFSLKLESLSEKILPISTDLSILMQSSSEKDKKLEKLESFEKFKNKAESVLLSQNIRLNKSLETISEMRSKYDKIFIENLTIPGFVGHSCKYKNISEYIIHNIKEGNKNEKQYNDINNEVITLKQKVENLFKLYFGIFDSVYDRTNKLVESKIEEVKINIGKKLEEIWEKINEIKLKDIENRMNIEKHLNEFKLFTEDVYGFKEQLDKLQIKIENNELSKIKDEIDENNNEKINEKKNENNENLIDIKKSIDKLKKENEEIIKINKAIEDKEIKLEKILLNNINDIKDLKEEMNTIKMLIKSGQNENKMKIVFNALNQFNNELNQVKQNIKEIKSKNINYSIKYQMLNNFPKKIKEEKISNIEPQKDIEIIKENQKEKEERKNISSLSNNIVTSLNNINNKEDTKKEKENMNTSESKDLKNNKSFKKSRNSGIIISKNKNVDDIKNLFLTRYKHKNKKNIINKENTKLKSMSINIDSKKIEDNLIKEETKIIRKKDEINTENKINKTYIPNIYEEKSTQYKLESAKNNLTNDNTNIFNLSFNDISGNKTKRKKEFLSPIVDKMYKQYYIKNNIKEKNKENKDEIKNSNQTIKKLVPAFGRTNYEPFNEYLKH